MIRSKCWLLTIDQEPKFKCLYTNAICYPPLHIEVPHHRICNCESATNTCRIFMNATPDKRTRVLFINSSLVAGADTWIHFLLLRNLPQDQFELHAAGQPGSPAPALDQLRAIPGIAVRPTNFGPSLSQQSNVKKLGSIARCLPATASLLGLAAYIRHHRIDIL